MAAHVLPIATLVGMPPPTRILIVDDSAELRELWLRLLRRTGFDVIQAADGLQALRATRERGPDLILMDIAMPALDGLAATRLIKADPTTAHIPVVILSGDAWMAPLAKRAGSAAFLTKPVAIAELLGTITQALRQAAPRPLTTCDARR